MKSSLRRNGQCELTTGIQDAGLVVVLTLQETTTPPNGVTSEVSITLTAHMQTWINRPLNVANLKIFSVIVQYNFFILFLIVLSCAQALHLLHSISCAVRQRSSKADASSTFARFILMGQLGAEFIS